MNNDSGMMHRPIPVSPSERRYVGRAPMTETETPGSLRLSNAWLARALEEPCDEHCAQPGQFCFNGGKSGVRGVCGARWERGTSRTRRQPLAPDELHPFAEAIRHTWRADAIREAEAQRRARLAVAR